MNENNSYLKQIYNSLPRLLALFDNDENSLTYGLADRYFWAWKLIDFGNGTFQGAANGLARLLKESLLPEPIARRSVLKRIDSIFSGTDFLRRRNGSMEEAWPFESSYCVTALVAYDLLTAVELLGEEIDALVKKRYLAVISPMIHFLEKGEETHAFISNHLATACAALFKWTLITSEESKKANKILSSIIRNQSIEGWFLEYEGADLGYQTLCMHYLADVHRMRPDLNLTHSLAKSIEFLAHFAFPDGSFGGNFGSRNTRFYYPSGIEYLKKEIPAASALARFMSKSIGRNNTVTLAAMDEPNLIPMFNSYCWAASIAAKENGSLESDEQIPQINHQKTYRYTFKEAGLVVDKAVNRYTVISWNKGGVIYNYDFEKKAMEIDCGLILKSKSGKLFSTQAYNIKNKFEITENEMVVQAIFNEMHKQLPTPLQFIVLRLMALTIMKNARLGNFIKNILVRILITNKKSCKVSNTRRIEMGSKLAIVDSQKGEVNKFSLIKPESPFSAIHMASQGYWQIQDDKK